MERHPTVASLQYHSRLPEGTYWRSYHGPGYITFDPPTAAMVIKICAVNRLRLKEAFRKDFAIAAAVRKLSGRLTGQPLLGKKCFGKSSSRGCSEQLSYHSEKRGMEYCRHCVGYLILLPATRRLCRALLDVLAFH